MSVGAEADGVAPANGPIITIYMATEYRVLGGIWMVIWILDKDMYAIAWEILRCWPDRSKLDRIFEFNGAASDEICEVFCFRCERRSELVEYKFIRGDTLKRIWILLVYLDCEVIDRSIEGEVDNEAHANGTIIAIYMVAEHSILGKLRHGGGVGERGVV